MKKHLHILFTILVLAAFKTIDAQDPHFSNYSFTPLFQNPALTGIMPGNLRITAVHRNQWRKVLDAESYRTYAVSFDHRGCLGNSDFFSWGIKALRDEAGDSRLTTHHAGLTGSYNKVLDANRKKPLYLVAGGSVGFVQRQYNLSGFRFDEQFDGFTFNSSLPNFEEFERDQSFMVDLGIGLLIYQANSYKDFIWRIGVAFDHVNQPNYKFSAVEIPGESRLNMKVVVHAQADFKAGQNKRLIPKLLFQRQGKFWQSQVSTGFEFPLDPKSGARNRVAELGVGARLGGWYQNQFLHFDALLLTGRIDFDGWVLGATYDLNFSKLNQVSNFRGGFDVGIMVDINRKQGGCSIVCPKF